MQTYRSELNLCQIKAVWKFTNTSYEAHIQLWFYGKICSIDEKVKFSKIDS